MQCPNCGSTQVQSRGRGSRSGTKRFHCQNDQCEKRWFTVDVREQSFVFEAPRILVFDIETSTILAELFDTGKQYVGRQHLLESWFMLSWAGQWLYDDEVFGDVVTPKEAKNRNDRRIVSTLWSAIDEADILIHYNGDGFDIPRFNTRCLEHGFQRPSFYQSIDLYKTVKNVFDFSSNAMDYVAERLQLERKRQNGGWNLWQRATRGEQSALDEMFEYNLGDIHPCSEMYLELRAWIKNHPKIQMLDLSDEAEQCGYCGSTEIVPKDKLVPVGLNLYRSFRCSNCGGIGRYKQGNISKREAKLLTRTLNY